MSTMGKCQECRLVYHWRGKPLLRDAYCIHCRKALRQTTWAIGRARTTRGTWTRTAAHPFYFKTLKDKYIANLWEAKPREPLSKADLQRAKNLIDKLEKGGTS